MHSFIIHHVGRQGKAVCRVRPSVSTLSFEPFKNYTSQMDRKRGNFFVFVDQGTKS